MLIIYRQIYPLCRWSVRLHYSAQCRVIADVHAVQPASNPGSNPPTRRVANKGRSIRKAPHDHGQIERGDALIAPVAAHSDARCGRMRTRPLTIQPVDDCGHQIRIWGVEPNSANIQRFPRSEIQPRPPLKADRPRRLIQVWAHAAMALHTASHQCGRAPPEGRIAMDGPAVSSSFVRQTE